jgi:hypothetical protein
VAFATVVAAKVDADNVPAVLRKDRRLIEWVSFTVRSVLLRRRIFHPKQADRSTGFAINCTVIGYVHISFLNAASEQIRLARPPVNSST